MYIKLPLCIIYPHNSNNTRNPPKSPCRSPIGLVQFVQPYKFRIRKSRLNRPAEMGDRSMLVSQQQQQVEIEFGGRKGCTSSKKKMKSSNKRRFSEEQVRWLETMFQNEAKLEPRQKAEVAAQLGLHPRQVAIWFQNKRARWKSRQLQQDFDALRRDYGALVSRFDLLKRDNHSLSLQLQKLKDLVGKTQEHNKVDAVVNDQESESNNEKKPGLSIDEECQYTNYFGMEESAANLLAMVEPTCSSLTSDEEWHGLQSDGLFDQSPRSCEWWDFWS